MDTFNVRFSANLLMPDGAAVIPSELMNQLDLTEGLRYEFLSRRTPRVTAEHIRDVHLFVLGNLLVGEHTFSEGAETLAYLCNFSLGYDTVDLAACTRAGVAVTRTRGISKHTVASGALTLMLSLSKRLMDKQRIARSGDWQRSRGYWGHDIDHKVLGIVGLGDIGRELVRLVQPFAMRIIGSDPYVGDDVFNDLGVERVDLAELLEQSDLVSLHCSLTPETTGLIDERELRRMKPTAYLINTARGPVVRQQALASALSEGWIAGAGIDVFEVEPLPADDPLIQLDNAILTPHTVGASHESVQRGSEMIIAQILAAARGELPDHILNLEVLDTEAFQRKLRPVQRMHR